MTRKPRRDGEHAEGAAPEQDAYDALQVYTLEHGDPRFLHQHVVDAWAAQHAREDSKPIAPAFALIGLYLHLERGCSGRDVQRAHMTLARRKREWPRFALPKDRGAMTANRVMEAAPGRERDEAIDAWCASVWNAFASQRDVVVELLREYGIE